MAATLKVAAPQQAFAVGGLRARIIDVSFAATDYPTGGYPITPASVNLSEIYGVAVIGENIAAFTTSPYFKHNVLTGKLQAFVSNGASPAFLNEAPAATDISAHKVRLLIVGV